MALPIKLNEIRSWISLFQVSEIAEFINIIQAMDMTFLRFVNENIDDSPLEEMTMDWLDGVLTEVKND